MKNGSALLMMPYSRGFIILLLDGYIVMEVQRTQFGFIPLNLAGFGLVSVFTVNYLQLQVMRFYIFTATLSMIG